MAQIPVFEQSQRLEPSSPTGIAGSEGVAGNLRGKAMEELGSVLTAFGNKLDEAGKRAKDQDDKYSLKIALAQFERDALAMKAESAAAPIIKDDGTGIGAAKVLGKNLEGLRKDYVGRFTSPTLQKMFVAESEESILKAETLALASEVKKREENIPILRQELLNTYAKNTRFGAVDPAIAMGKYENDILEDVGIPDADKPAMILKGKVHIASEKVFGAVDAAMYKKNGASAIAGFADARALLERDFAGVLNGDEKLKLRKHIDDQQDYYMTQNWKIYTQTKTLSEDQRHADEVKATGEILTLKMQAGANQTLINAANDLIAKDDRLGSDAKKALWTMPQLYEAQNDKAEIGFKIRMYTTPRSTKSLINDLTVMRLGGEIDDERHRALLNEVLQKADQDKKNTNWTKLEEAGADRIKAKYGASVIDPLSTLYKKENVALMAQDLFAYQAKLVRLRAAGTTSQKTIDDAVAGVYRDRGTTEMQQVNGSGPETIKDLTGAKSLIDSLVRKKELEWSTYSTDKKKDWNVKFSQAAKNHKNFVEQESNKIPTYRPQSTKVIGDE